MPTTEQDTFGGDLVGAVTIATAVVDILPRGHGWLRFADRAGEVWCGGRVHVVSRRIDVHGLRGDHHRRSDIIQQRQQIPRVCGGEAQAVDEQIGSRAQGRREFAGLAAIRSDEPSSRCRDILGHARPIPANGDHVPTSGQQPARGGAADQPGATENDRTRH
jgi:hypothetical protein